jgi:hypothetical protein
MAAASQPFVSVEAAGSHRNLDAIGVAPDDDEGPDAAASDPSSLDRNG